MNKIIYLMGILSIGICITVILWNTYRLKKTMGLLNQMLDSAINNDFESSHFNESQLSQLEAKLSRFLASSSISRRNIESEKEQIKGLIGDISHQTKTPIATMLLYVQLLQEQPDLPLSCLPLVTEIGNQTEKLNFLIQFLVKTSRLENGMIQLTSKEEPIAKLVEALLPECQLRAQEKNITLRASIPQGLSAQFDPKWTAEALYNVIDNALKYTASGGKIHITATEYEMFCRIDITDTGIGILEGDQPKIFQRFYRSPSVREQEGVGIGLFLTRKILGAQGGYIKVSSTPGKGSTFSVFLPKARYGA